MNDFNVKIHQNILEIMKLKGETSYSLSKKANIKRTTLDDKLARLKKGHGISTNSLHEIASLLEVPVYMLIK